MRTTSFTRFSLLFRCCLLVVCSPVLAGKSHAADLQIALQDADVGGGVADAVVEILLPDAMQADYRLAEEFSVDQADKEFVPNVTVIGVGSRIRFPNSDNILHHVYSFSSPKVFELPLYGQGQNVDYTEVFEQAGVVELGCNIHDWMLGYIYVAQTRLAVKTDAEGRAVIPDVPAGTYELRIWHPRLPSSAAPMTHSLTIAEAETTSLRMALTLERDSRLRRSPNVSRTRYR